MFILILNWSEYFLALILSKTQVVTLPVELSKLRGRPRPAVGRQAACRSGSRAADDRRHEIRKHLARGFSFGMVRR